MPCNLGHSNVILKFGMELVQNGEDMIVFSNSSEHNSRTMKLRSANFISLGFFLIMRILVPYTGALNKIYCLADWLPFI